MTSQDSNPAIHIRDSTGVQAGDHNTQQIIENYIAQQVVQRPTERAACVVVGEVPQKAPAFQDRPELASILQRNGSGVSVVRAVTGMRGVGKTQIAAAYARDRIDAQWQLVTWINAAAPAQVLRGLADTATALGLGQPGQDLAELGHAVRHWLEADGDRCLLVYDNADDLDFLAEFVPVAGRGQVVITSNQSSAIGFGTAVPVDVFTEAEAIEFLGRRCEHAAQVGATELAAELGYLPLALAQAAAVIAAQRLSYSAYLDRLREIPVQDYLRRVTGEPYPHGVAEAIALALDSAAQTDPTGLSQSLMDLIALLSETGVSRSLLHAAGQLGVLTRPDRLSANSATVDEALGHLASRSLVTLSIDGTTVTAHRLTMRVARERAGDHGSLAVSATAVIELLTKVGGTVGEPKQNREAARDIVGQILAVHDHLATQKRGKDLGLTKAILKLRVWAVYCLNELGDSFTQAITYGAEVLADHEEILGDTHADTLQSRNSLAFAYWAAGRLNDAIALEERNLLDREQILGDTHPDTLQSRNNLAVSYRTAGRMNDAIELYERTLADREQILGDTHPDTLKSRNNLATAYWTARRLNDAIALGERTLTDRERLLGDTHPDTLNSRSNLAVAYQTARRLNDAIELYERTLADREQILGDTHPDTLTSRNNLAAAYQDAGRLNDAIPLYERTLADREQTLGDTHPSTLTSRNNLATAYQEVGRLDDAKRLRDPGTGT
jgi:tetratricopeptide (TPR) repeat protein